MQPRSRFLPLGWRRAAVLLLLVTLAYGSGVGGDFVMDDGTDIVFHPVVGGDEPISNIFRYNYVGQELDKVDTPNTVRPLATLSFAAEWAMWGYRPWMFQLVTLAWLLAGTLLAMRFYQRFVDENVAFAAAAIFSCLAIHCDAVGSVAHRAEIMSLVLALAALETGLRRRWMLSVGCYLLALLAKESAFLTPLVMAWLVLVFHGKRGFRREEFGPAVSALVIAAAMFFAVRLMWLDIDSTTHVLPVDNVLMRASFPERVWMPFALLGRYVALALAPVELSADYSFSAIIAEVDPSDPYAWLGIGLALASIYALVIAYRHRDKREMQVLAAIIGSFYISYALFSNSVFLIVTIFAERLFFAPSLWLCLLLAHVGSQLGKTARAKQFLRILLWVFLAVQILQSAVRSLDYRDDLALNLAQVQTEPRSCRGHYHLARTYGEVDKPAEAIWHFGLSVACRISLPTPWWPPSNAPHAVEDRLRMLPELIAPNFPAEEFWSHYWHLVKTRLNEDAADYVEEFAELRKAALRRGLVPRPELEQRLNR